MRRAKTSNPVIPKGWVYVPFGEVFEFIQSLSLSRDQLTFEECEREIFNIHYGDIHSTFKADILDFETEKRIPRIKNSIPSKDLRFIKDGDLVIADASEDYEGVAANIEIANIKGRKVTGGLHTFVARDKCGLTVIGFRAYILKNPAITNNLKKLATGSKVYGISKANLSTLNVLIPSKQEQIKIAKILSTWNLAIETIEQLISKKERRKKALMQMLFTGKKRFKGFSKLEIKEKNLSDVTKLVRGPFGGALKKEIFVESGYKVYEQKNAIYNDFEIGKYFIDEAKYKELNRFKIESNDVIMSCSGTAGKLAIVPRNARPGVINQALLKITVDPKYLVTDYFIQFVNSPIFLNQLFVDLAGGAIKNVGSVSVLNKIRIIVPSIEEQKKIAAVLSSADSEIKILKRELLLYKNQRRGLMQEMLTGNKKVKS